MSQNDPRKGEGWNFMEDESQAWYKALETVEDEEGNQTVNVDHYDEFDNIQELVNFVAGTGSYSNTRRFTPSQEDLQMKKRELHNDEWRIPDKIQEINQYLEQGVTQGEIDIDPSAKAAWNVSETQAHIDKHDTKYTAHFLAYDPDEEGEGEEVEAQFYISSSWYDTPPEEMNIEDVFKSAFQEQEK